MHITFTDDEEQIHQAMLRRGMDFKREMLETLLHKQLRARDEVAEDAKPRPSLRLERDERGRRFVVAD